MSDAKLATDDRVTVDISLLVLRVIVGVIFAAHGAQKLFGLFESTFKFEADHASKVLHLFFR